MLPIRDEDPSGRGLGYVTLTLIAINLLVFLFLQLPNEAFTYLAHIRGFVTGLILGSLSRALLRPRAA